MNVLNYAIFARETTRINIRGRRLPDALSADSDDVPGADVHDRLDADLRS
jgi:hypothetical protein